MILKFYPNTLEEIKNILPSQVWQNALTVAEGNSHKINGTDPDYYFISSDDLHALVIQGLPVEVFNLILLDGYLIGHFC